MRQTANILALVCAFLFSAYLWHVLTLAFAVHLERAVTSNQQPGVPGMVTFVDLIGVPHAIDGSAVQPQVSYRHFISTAGNGTPWGVGRFRRSYDYEFIEVLQWLLILGLGTTAIFLASGAVASASVLRACGFDITRTSAFLRTGLRHQRFSLLVPPATAILSWYLCYPRMQLGDGVFHMHELAMLILPCVSLVFGVINGFVRSLVVCMLQDSKRCERCGYPRVASSTFDFCTDCGATDSKQWIERRILLRSAQFLLVGTVLTSAAFLVWDSPTSAYWRRGDRIVWWLLMRPLGPV